MKIRSLEQAIDFGENYENYVANAAKIVIELCNKKTPEFGIVLGSGLDDLANEIKSQEKISFEDAGFPETTVEGHTGEIIVGELEGVRVIGFSGRKHFYEVADMPFGILQTVFPVHVLANALVKNYFVTNAAGGLNLNYNVGDIMIIKSHINMIPNILLGRHLDFLKIGSLKKTDRFQPMNGAYDANLKLILNTAVGLAYAEEKKTPISQGIYMAVTGPSYETEGECIAFRKMGADAVGMSTTSEAIVARNRGMNVVGFSCITNKIAEDGTNDTNHEEVRRILESDEVKTRLHLTIQKFFRLYRDENIIVR
jgi:purine-nucleoside phosphorylase